MEKNPRKVFTIRAISIVSFFGGPIAAGFLISKNYKAFEKENAALNSIFIGVISTILIFAGLFFTPERISDSIPITLIPPIYTALITALVERLQGQKIENYLEKYGQKASNWQAAGFGFLGFLIIAGFLAIMIPAIPIKGYEKSITIEKDVILYYGKKIDESKSHAIADAIKQSRFLQASDGADLFLSDEPENYRLKFVLIDTSVLSDTLNDFNRFQKYLNYNLNLEKRIEVSFTDIKLLENFELRKITFSDPQIYEPLLYLEAYHVNDYHVIYYNLNMPIEEVKIVEEAVKRLRTYFPINQPIDIVFLNNDNNYTIKFFVEKSLWQNPANLGRIRGTIDYIKSSGIEKDIEIVLIDNQSYEELSI
jgi:hypothetical protein